MAELGDIVITKRPQLASPQMLVGFSGWLDGGEASTGTVRYLVSKLRAIKFAEMSSAPYTVYQLPGLEVIRPRVKTQEGVIQSIEMPKNEAFYYKGDLLSRDLVLFVGAEPNLMWERFADNLLSMAKELGVTRLYSVGAVLDRTPISREPRVSCSVSDAKLKDEMSQYAVRFGSYQGPTTFQSYLIDACARHGIEGVHFSSRAAFYPEVDVAIPRNPRTVLALVKRLNILLGVNINLSDLQEEAQGLEDKLQEMMSNNPKLREYMQQLEQSYSEVRYDEPIKGEPEDFVRDAEDFLRRQRETGPP